MAKASWQILGRAVVNKHFSLRHGIVLHFHRNFICHSADSSKTLGKVPPKQVASLAKKPNSSVVSTSSVVRMSWAGLEGAKG